MSYLNHCQIEALCKEGQVVGHLPQNINTASLDLRLGKTILVERCPAGSGTILDYRKRTPISTRTVVMDEDEGFVLHPGQFILAHSMEICNFRDDIAALLRVKSTQGRMGFEHMDAGWVDPGFHGALTLEFKNENLFHPIRIRPGDNVAQLIFFRGQMVDPEFSYRYKGNYNGSVTVVPSGFYRD